MGFVGPNGAGKTTSIRILMGLLGRDAGEVRLLGHRMPDEQVAAKWDIGFVTDDMKLLGGGTLGWHMRFVKSLYESWDDAYAQSLLKRFYLRPEQPVRGLSHGERTKALLLLALARRPKLLVLDEPTSGLDPVARHEVLAELIGILEDETRSVLFSSHNTLDVEQISDQITFIDRGRIVASQDKESFLEQWRRVRLDLPEGMTVQPVAGVTEVSQDAHSAIITTNRWHEGLLSGYESSGAQIADVQRMTLEEIFVASVMHTRAERGE